MTKLFRILNENAKIKFENQNFNEILSDQDWRKYVPECYAKSFDKLRIETKKAIFVMAELQARTEQYKDVQRNKTDLITKETREKLKNRDKTNRMRTE